MTLYIHCPFEDKDEAKALGARWSPREKRWYAPDEATYGALKKWHKKRTLPREKPYQRGPKSKSAWDGETKMEYRARQACGSAYKGVWGGVPSVEQHRMMKAGVNLPFTAYDTRGD